VPVVCEKSVLRRDVVLREVVLREVVLRRQIVLLRDMTRREVVLQEVVLREVDARKCSASRNCSVEGHDATAMPPLRRRALFSPHVLRTKTTQLEASIKDR